MVFIEDHGFARNRRGILDDDNMMDLFSTLAARPDAGNVIKGSGGLRKLRWGASGRGKRGGARIIYYWWMADDKILLLDIYEKSEKEDLAAKEISRLRTKVIE